LGKKTKAKTTEEIDIFNLNPYGKEKSNWHRRRVF